MYHFAGAKPQPPPHRSCDDHHHHHPSWVCCGFVSFFITIFVVAAGQYGVGMVIYEGIDSMLMGVVFAGKGRKCLWRSEDTLRHGKARNVDGFLGSFIW